MRSTSGSVVTSTLSFTERKTSSTSLTPWVSLQCSRSTCRKIVWLPFSKCNTVCRPKVKETFLVGININLQDCCPLVLAWCRSHHTWQFIIFTIFTITACIFSSSSFSISFWTQDLAPQQILSSTFSFPTGLTPRTLGPSNDFTLLNGWICLHGVLD